MPATDQIRDFFSKHHPDWDFYFAPQLPSTNTTAWELYKADFSRPILVLTDDQTAGRGRGTNRWFSQPGNSLTFTLLLSPEITADQSGLIPILTGVALVQALEKYGVSTKLKWPNDILLGGKKLGGILCESRIKGEKLTAAAIGIGMNISIPLNQFPEEIRGNTTSLLAAGHDINREDLLMSLFNELIEQFEHFSPRSIQTRWNSRGAYLDRDIIIRMGNTTINGKFKGIAVSGAALLEIDGRNKIFTSGEISKIQEAQ